MEVAYGSDHSGLYKQWSLYTCVVGRGLAVFAVDLDFRNLLTSTGKGIQP